MSYDVPITRELLAEHLRLDGALIDGAMRYAAAAAREVEHYAGIVLFRQTITAVACAYAGGRDFDILTGPLLNGEPVTVSVRQDDGSIAVQPDGWSIVAHYRFPRIRFEQSMSEREVIVTYVAGYGDDAAALPRDLAHAIAEQALALYDHRGDLTAKPGLAPAAARILARYRGVRI